MASHLIGLQEEEAYSPTQEADAQAGLEEQDSTSTPRCTGIYKRGLGSRCNSESMPFDGYNIHRCGRHRLCHGQFIETGYKCEQYVYKGNALCDSCQSEGEKVRVLTVESEDQVVHLMDLVNDTLSPTKTQRNSKKKAKAVTPAKAAAPVPAQVLDQTNQTKPAPTSTVAGARRSGRLSTGKTVAKKAAKLSLISEVQHQTPRVIIEQPPSGAPILAGAAPSTISSVHRTSNDKTYSPATHSRITFGGPPLTLIKSAPESKAPESKAPKSKGKSQGRASSERPATSTKAASKSKSNSRVKASSAPPPSPGIGSSAAAVQDTGNDKGKTQAQHKRPPQRQPRSKPKLKPDMAGKEKKMAAQGEEEEEKEGKEQEQEEGKAAAAEEDSIQTILAKIAELQRLLEVTNDNASTCGGEGEAKEEEEGDQEEDVGDAKTLMSGALRVGEHNGLDDADDGEIPGEEDDNDEENAEEKDNDGNSSEGADDDNLEEEEEEESEGKEEEELSGMPAKSFR